MRKSVYLLSVILVVALAACGRGEVVIPVTPTVFVPSGAATSTAQAVADVTATAQAVDAPPTTEAVLGEGDAAAGQVLFNTMQSQVGFACVTCHHTDSEARLIGPGLQNISERAATRVEGESAAEYIHNSIVNPQAFVVPPDAGGPYPENLMPQVYATLFTEEQINDLVAYLLTL
ncbi:MAG: cytochrome c [Anaerolineae bacterium]|nr:cytochrome c [Anaerolineae bacterium]